MEQRHGLLGACLAEAVGTFLMVFFGTGTVFVAVTTGALQGLWQVAVVWGVIIALAIQITGAISDAHLNPAVTLACAVWRRFPRARTLGYVLAQLAGAFTAAALLFALYGTILARYEQQAGIIRGAPGSERSAMVFGEYFPHPGLFHDAPEADRLVGLPAAMAAEGLGTAILVLCIFALTDRRNPARPRGALVAWAIGATVAALIAVIAPLTQAGFNPARDFGPRLFAFLAGWGRIAIPGPRGGFFWVYIFAPVCGGIVGGGVYDHFLRRLLPASNSNALQRSTTMQRTRCILVGGFLAAGKTTALARLAQAFAAQGQKPGLIVNDQSDGLVDTARLSQLGLPLAEITGGCFCCRFDTFLGAAKRLVTDAAPDVILAEPVGSCTDLAATVAYPLRREHGDAFDVAPFSVLVDPTACAAMLGLDASPSPALSEDVRYIYRKQLEEADILVLNKCDLLDAGQRERLRCALAAMFPRAVVLPVSCRTGEGIASWITALTTVAPGTGPAMDVDYDRYAAGEALLGWYNASADLLAGAADDQDALRSLADALRYRLRHDAIPIAHLKMSLTDTAGSPHSAVSVCRSDGPVETTLFSPASASGRNLTINLRAEADPDALSRCIAETVSAMGGSLHPDTVRAFRPGRPQPTHRLERP